jgi:hypothetical protein
LATDSSHLLPGQYVRSISITQGSFLSDQALLALLQHTPLLTYLELSSTHNITDTSFQHLPISLTHLELCGANRLTHMAMANLSHHCQYLTKVTFSYCPGFGAPEIFEALQHGPLKELTILSPCQQLASPVAALALTKWDQLTSLAISGDRDMDHTHYITTNPKTCWPHLTRFSLDACSTLDHDALVIFLQHHPHLTYLGLLQCHLTDALLDAIPEVLPELKALLVQRNPLLTAAGLCRLAKTNRLASISCGGCGIFWNSPGFPMDDLDWRAYEMGPGGLVWLAGNAFDADAWKKKDD